MKDTGTTYCGEMRGSSSRVVILRPDLQSHIADPKIKQLDGSLDLFAMWLLQLPFHIEDKPSMRC